MKYILIFLLLLPVSHALSVGVSPDTINLSRSGDGSFKIINPNDHAVAYSITGLINSKSSITGSTVETISFNAKESGFIQVNFNSKKGKLSLKPSLRIQVDYPEVDKKPWLLFGFFIGIALFLFVKFSLSYFSTLQNRSA